MSILTSTAAPGRPRGPVRAAGAVLPADGAHSESAVRDRQAPGSDSPSHTPSHTPVFDVIVTPHLSLADRGYTWLIVGVLAAALLVQIFFLLIGVWVAGVYVLVDGVVLAFALTFFRAEADRAERITVEAGTIRIERRRGDAIVDRIELPVWGSVVERDQDPDYGCRAIRLRHRQRRVEIARDLAPAERVAFLDALTRALAADGTPMRVETTAALPLLAA